MNSKATQTRTSRPKDLRRRPMFKSIATIPSQKEAPFFCRTSVVAETGGYTFLVIKSEQPVSLGRIEPIRHRTIHDCEKNTLPSEVFDFVKTCTAVLEKEEKKLSKRISKEISLMSDSIYETFLTIATEKNLTSIWRKDKSKDKLKEALRETFEDVIKKHYELGQYIIWSQLEGETSSELNITTNSAIWEKLLNQDTWLTSANVALNAGSKNTNNPSALANRWKKAGKIFAVSRQGKDWYPAYEFMDDGHPIPLMKDLLDILKPKNTDLAIACWFENHNSWLDGMKPKDVLMEEPEELLKAARVEVSGEMHG
ncbi:hypothetical protein [Pseudidiomarina aestuarii]|uniref:hypothetical protein n=1 Tax=Pseudidiomarina aestuarii TaxID=624146 RepID=UPI003A96BF6F